jgi:hypothetical protein
MSGSFCEKNPLTSMRPLGDLPFAFCGKAQLAEDGVAAELFAGSTTVALFLPRLSNGRWSSCAWTQKAKPGGAASL